VSFGEKTIFPMQNFNSVSAGRNRDNLEKQVKVALRHDGKTAIMPQLLN
jgi:hypothetical protein